MSGHDSNNNNKGSVNDKEKAIYHWNERWLKTIKTIQQLKKRTHNNIAQPNNDKINEVVRCTLNNNNVPMEEGGVILG